MIKKIKAKINSANHLREILTGSAITFVLNISGMLLGYIVVLYISRKYGAEGIGVYNLTLSIMTFFAMVASMGMNVSILRYVGQFNQSGDHYKLKHLYHYVIELVVPFSVLLSIVLYFFSDSIAQNIFHNSVYVPALKFSAFILPFFALQNVSVEFIRGLKQLKVSEFLRSVNRPLVNLTLLWIVGNFNFIKSRIETFLTILYNVFEKHFNLLNDTLKNWNIGEITKSIDDFIFHFFLVVPREIKLLPIYTLGFSVIVTAIFAVFFIVKKLRSIESKKTDDFSKKELISTSLPMMVTTLALFIQGNISLFMLEMFTTTEMVGIYSVALKISLIISIVLTVVNTISAPKFSELYWDKKPERLQQVINSSVKLIFYCSLFLAVILMMFATPVLTMFGDKFATGDFALRLLIAGQLVNAATGSVGLFMNMTGQHKALRNIIITTTSINLVFSYVLIPVYGINGAAFSSMATAILANVIAAYYVKTRLNYTTYYTIFN